MVKMELAMKKKSLEDSLRGHSAQVEDEKLVEVVGENRFKELLEKCRKHIFGKHSSTIDEVLTPVELNTFLHYLATLEGDVENWHQRGDHCINKLIKNSYEAGYNNFVFHTEGLPQMSLCHHFKANGNRPLNIEIFGSVSMFGSQFEHGNSKVYGDVGDNLGINSQNSTYLVEGNAGRGVGVNSYNSCFTIHGNVGDECGYKAKNCLFDIKNLVTTYDLAGDSEYSIFRIENMGSATTIALNSKGCDFISPNEFVIDALTHYLFNKGSNRIFREHSDGKLKEVVVFGRG